MLKATILEAWSEDWSKLPPQLTRYYHMRDALGMHDGLVFNGELLVVHQGVRAEIKTKDMSHITGVEGCLRWARENVYWPCMNAELRHWISTYEPCRLFEVPHGKETLMSHEVTQRTWEKVAVDLLTKDQKDYLVTVDYYSRFWELDRLHTTDSGAVVRKIKTHFARYGGPY